MSTVSIGRYAVKLCICTALLAGLFALAVYMRSEHLFTLSKAGHQWNTAGAALYIDNWHLYGAFAERFLLVELPRGALYETIAQRTIYPSFPPLFLLPPFLLKTLLPSLDTLVILHCWNLAVSLITATLVSAIVLIFAGNETVGDDSTSEPVVHWAHALAAMASGAAYLFAKWPFYLHAMNFFSDMAVIPIIAAFLLVESRIRSVGHETWPATALLCGLAFAGVLTDHFTAIVLMTWAGLRILFPTERGRPSLRQGSLFLVPAIGLGALAVWIGQLYDAGAIGDLRAHASTRTILSNHEVHGFAGVPDIGFIARLAERITPAGLMLLGVGTGLAGWGLIRRTAHRAPAWAPVLMLGIVSVLASWTFFSGHVWVHDFTVLKIFPVLALTIGVSTILCIRLAAQHLEGRSRLVIVVLPLFIGAAATIILAANWRDLFPSAGYLHQNLAQALAPLRDDQTVFLSASTGWFKHPPHEVMESRTVLHHTPDYEEAEALRLRTLDVGARLVLIDPIDRLTGCAGLAVEESWRNLRATVDGKPYAAIELDPRNPLPRTCFSDE